MAEFPRLVFANLSEDEEPSASTLAVMAALRGHGHQVQYFRSLAAFTPIDYITPVTGIAARHLDPWIMSGSLCRELFARSAEQVDLSIIEGCMRTAADSSDSGCPNGWRKIAQILNAPVVGVVPSQPSQSFHAPALPAGIDALFIDGVASREHYDAEKTALEGMFGLPLLGGLAAGHPAADGSDKMRPGRRASGLIMDELTRGVMQVIEMDKLLELARSRPFPLYASELFAGAVPRRALRVAVAYDDCFHCYFPDTLDALEFLGAEICAFSPLAEEKLPEASDIVYIGCGHPEQHMRDLAHNECMRAALCDHVCAGRRVYAEGGGAAYLCQKIRLPDGSTMPMVGIFAAEAQFMGQALRQPQPVVLQCDASTWIAGQGETIRGYRTGAWRLAARPGLTACFTARSTEPDGIVRHHCVGSTVHLNFAAQPRVLEAFFAPHAPSLSVARRPEA